MVLALSSTFRTVAWILAVVLLLGWIAYYWFNIRAAKPEIGAELELAANIKTPPADEELEGKRLETVQFFGVVFLLLIGIGLPFYWLREPGRQSGAVEYFADNSMNRGARLYAEGFQCSTCHGGDGGGGVAPFILPVPLKDDAGDLVMADDGSVQTFNIQVAWTAPNLQDALLRYSEEEIREILIYGRANSPMPAWGVAGGGVGTDQQIQQVIDYLWSITISPEEAIAANTADLDAARARGGADFDDGEWLFQQHCARCHTQGWQWAQNTTEANLAIDAATVAAAEGAGGTELPIGSQGGGAFGPRLAKSNLAEQFLTVEDMVDFITSGADDNVRYGTRGLGNGQMPGYGQMLTNEQITSIVEYERSLEHDEAPVLADFCGEFVAGEVENLGDDYPVDMVTSYCDDLLADVEGA